MYTNSDPVPGGVLRLGDLELRADAAYARHMNTYTAASVLSVMLMVAQDPDEDVRPAVTTVRAALDRYRLHTRREWRDSYRRWADAAGVEVDESTFLGDVAPDGDGFPDDDIDGDDYFGCGVGD